jgi:hypothetical protein
MGPVLQIPASAENIPSGDDAPAPGSPAGPSIQVMSAAFAATPADQQDIADYDRWLVLEAELTPLGPKIKEQAELRKKILKRFPNLAPHLADTVNGTEADIWISPCDNARKITVAGKKALHKLWGLRLFRLNASFTLEQLPDPKDPQGLYTVQERTGPRHLKALPRLKPAA